MKVQENMSATQTNEMQVILTKINESLNNKRWQNRTNIPVTSIYEECY